MRRAAPRGGLHILEGNEISFPCWESKPRTSSPKPRQNTHYAIQATYNIIIDSINILYPTYTLLPLQLTVNRRNILSATWYLRNINKNNQTIMFTINHFTSLINFFFPPCCCIWNAILNFWEALNCWRGYGQIKFALYQWIKINNLFHFRTNTNITGRTLLYFYFSKGTSLRTRRDIITSWHELMGEYATENQSTMIPYTLFHF
jgi:hypothetical protein